MVKGAGFYVSQLVVIEKQPFICSGACCESSIHKTRDLVVMQVSERYETNVI